MDANTFDGIIATNPNFPMNVHDDGYRILVLRDLHDYTNRTTADLILFAKNGLVSVLYNKYGPPGATLPIARAYLTALITLEKYSKYWHEHRNHANAYERSWKGEPTNNDDFRWDHLDPCRNIEPVDE